MRFTDQCFGKYVSDGEMKVQKLADSIYYCQILWLVGALAWGTLRIIALKILSNVPGEGDWGFGQILPLLLSVLPIWSICSSIYGKKVSRLRA